MVLDCGVRTGGRSIRHKLAEYSTLLILAWPPIAAKTRCNRIFVNQFTLLTFAGRTLEWPVNTLLVGGRKTVRIAAARDL